MTFTRREQQRQGPIVGPGAPRPTKAESQANEQSAGGELSRLRAAAASRAQYGSMAAPADDHQPGEHTTSRKASHVRAPHPTAHSGGPPAAGDRPADHHNNSNSNNNHHHADQHELPAVVDQAPPGNDGARRGRPAPPASMLERAARRIPGLGIMLALCASLFLGTAGMLVKMTQSVHGIQVAVFRAAIQLVIYGLIIALRGLPLVPSSRREWGPVLGRALLGGSSITLSYYALKLIPLGDATTIRFSLPIWTLIISYFLLGESCSLLKVAAVIICISGVVLIAKPDDCVRYANLLLHNLGLLVFGGSAAPEYPSSAEHPAGTTINYEHRASGNYSEPALNVTGNKLMTAPDQTLRQLEGCLMALGSSVCLSLSLICLRLCKQTAAEITILWLSVASIGIGTSTLVALNEFRLPDSLMDLIYILLNGLCGSIGQWFITSALKIEQSGIIALARTFDIEVAFLYSALLLHETIRTTSIVGSVLVSSGVIIVVVPKWFGGGPASRAPLKPQPDRCAGPAPGAPPKASPAPSSGPLTTMTIVSLTGKPHSGAN